MRTFIQTPTNNLKQSVQFYTKLNFNIISKNNPTIVSDGKAFIEINNDRYARAGVKLFQSNWESIVSQLEKITPVIKIDNGYLLSDPSGMCIYLIDSEQIVNYTIEESSSSVLGNYAGISIETTDPKKSIEICKLIGFTKSTGNIEHGWISLTNDEGFTISIMKPNMCPHLFYNPSLTYFNGGQNEEIIENIRKLKIPITEEITFFNKKGLVDNVIIQDPGGLGFFIFND